MSRSKSTQLEAHVIHFRPKYPVHWCVACVYFVRIADPACEEPDINTTFTAEYM